MRCIICDGKMEYFFSKKFSSYGLTDVDYWKCRYCGFCASKTHLEMEDRVWNDLNIAYHKSYQDKDHNPDDPRWLSRLETQASVLNDATECRLLGNRDGARWLDYACGGGQLAQLLKKSYGRTLLNYDRYMPVQSGFVRDQELIARTFDFVITTSVFEHLTRREQFDQVEGLVTDGGAFGLHTMVCESVPKDPEWFYLLPVHCALHTNKSMNILFNQWGYTSSVYNVEARLWLWFKNDPTTLQECVERANTRDRKPNYLFKRGFVDYWK